MLQLRLFCQYFYNYFQSWSFFFYYKAGVINKTFTHNLNLLSAV